MNQQNPSHRRPAVVPESATTRARRSVTAALAVATAVAGALVGAGSAAGQEPAPQQPWGPNPILADGSVYSADPATLVVDDELIIYAGRDEAAETQNDFIMNEWQSFTTADPATGEWEHRTNVMRPEEVFAWATPGRAYAGQVVAGPDGRFYWFVPVTERDSPSPDPFTIGVAVADDPYGPWTDNIGVPLVSQAILGNDAHNIDPTVLVEGDRVTMYWGSFGRLFQAPVTPAMDALAGPAQPVSGLPGFFEAAWLFERGGTYYLAYAANNVDPGCTPSVYHACLAHASAPTPQGPWTFQGRFLDVVSSTTSHPAITEFGGEWLLAYHTADAVGGNHFRRSVAVDRLEWDDTATPPVIRPVTTTPQRVWDTSPRTNVAPAAQVSVSNEPVPAQYWTKAINDEIVRPNPLPPDMWATWIPQNRPASHTVTLDLPQPVEVGAAEMDFWRDVAPGTGNGVSNPAAWRLEYRTDDGQWRPVSGVAPGYGVSTDGAQRVSFTPVTTTAVRAVIDASPGRDGFSGVAVEEFRLDAVTPVSLPDPNG